MYPLEVVRKVGADVVVRPKGPVRGGGKQSKLHKLEPDMERDLMVMTRVTVRDGR